MTDKNVRIVAKFIATAGKADDLKKVLSAGVKPSRAEEGCFHYDLYRNIEDGNVFLFHETWKDDAAVEIHRSQPHFKILITEAQPLLAQPPEVTKM